MRGGKKPLSYKALTPLPGLSLSLSSYLYSMPKVSFQDGQPPPPQAAAHVSTWFSQTQTQFLCPMSEPRASLTAPAVSGPQAIA